MARTSRPCREPPDTRLKRALLCFRHRYRPPQPAQTSYARVAGRWSTPRHERVALVTLAAIWRCGRNTRGTPASLSLR